MYSRRVGSLQGFLGQRERTDWLKEISGFTPAASAASSQESRLLRWPRLSATFQAVKLRVRFTFRLLKSGSLKVAASWSPTPTSPDHGGVGL